MRRHTACVPLGCLMHRNILKKLYGEDFDYDKVHTYRRKLTDQVLDEGPIEAKPGAEELLKYLRKKVCVQRLPPQEVWSAAAVC